MPDTSHPHQPAHITLAGEVIHLLASGLALWPDRRIAVVSDLHLEKASWFAATSGQMLPPYDSRETLDRLHDSLTAAADHTPIERLVLLGDTVHDAGGFDRLDAEAKHRFNQLVTRWRTDWIIGNHEHGYAPIGVAASEELAIGPLIFRHEAARLAPGLGEISGHFHPKVRLNSAQQRIWRNCFIADNRRLIMPAFGAFTGGLDVRDAAISHWFARGTSVYVGLENRLIRMPYEP